MSEEEPRKGSIRPSHYKVKGQPECIEIIKMLANQQDRKSVV